MDSAERIKRGQDIVAYCESYRQQYFELKGRYPISITLLEDEVEALNFLHNFYAKKSSESGAIVLSSLNGKNFIFEMEIVEAKYDNW